MYSCIILLSVSMMSSKLIQVVVCIRIHSFFSKQFPSYVEKEMATHSSTLAWRIPWTEEPGGLQSMGLQRVRQDWETSLSSYEYTTGCLSISLSMGIANFGLGWIKLLRTFSFPFKKILIILFIFIFWPCYKECGILAPWPRIEPVAPALEKQS